MEPVNTSMYFANCIFGYANYVAGLLNEPDVLTQPADVAGLNGKSFTYYDKSYIITLLTGTTDEVWMPEVKEDARDALTEMFHSCSESVERLYISFIMANSKSDCNTKFTHISYVPAGSYFLPGFTSSKELMKNYLESRLEEMGAILEGGASGDIKEKAGTEIELIDSLLKKYNDRDVDRFTQEVTDILRLAKPLRFGIRLKQ